MRPLNNITDKFTNVTSAQKKIHLLYFVGISICDRKTIYNSINDFFSLSVFLLVNLIYN